MSHNWLHTPGCEVHIKYSAPVIAHCSCDEVCNDICPLHDVVTHLAF